MGHDCRLGHGYFFRPHQGNSFSTMNYSTFVIPPKLTDLMSFPRNLLLMPSCSLGILLARLYALCSGELSTNPGIMCPIAFAW